MDKLKIQGRYTEEELSLVKNTFAENDYLLKVIRKVMLQMPLNAVDLASMPSMFTHNKEVMSVIRKCFSPQLDPEGPIQGIGDLFYWMPFNMVDQTPEIAYGKLVGRSKFSEYIDQQLDRLEGKGKEKIRFADMVKIGNKTDEELYSDMLARNMIISHTEQQLAWFKLMAGTLKETVQETLARLSKDSAK